MASSGSPKVTHHNFSQLLSDSDSSYARIGLNPKTGSLIDLDGVELHFPATCKAVLIQPRACGDYYAEIEGVGFGLSAIGSTTHEAARNVIARLPA